MNDSPGLAENSLDGFDPLGERLGESAQDRPLFEEATKRIVSNILKSYTSYFDVFSELIQNSLDAIDMRVRKGDHRQGIISVKINIPSHTITVVDNGVGMDERELKYCFRPSVSFKSRRESRGHKGVGATFLAYGFAGITVATKKNSYAVAVTLSGGKEWADELGETHLRPKLSATQFDVPELATEPSGTSVTVNVGPGNRPDLTWWSATSAAQWLELLKLRTPLGGVYLAGQAPPKTWVRVTVVDPASETTSVESRSVDYLWPHEIGGSILPKVKTVKEVQDHILRCEGDSARIAAEFRNLSALWDIWSEDDLLSESNSLWAKTFDENDARLIRIHKACVYGCFVSTAKSWTQYQTDILKIRRSPLLLRGGMQIASDFMVQGDLSVIPLTSTIGYQANTHVVIHFTDGNPDMGRKVFQPELKALSEKIARQSVNVFKKYIYLMREDSGAPSIQDSTELFNWRLQQLEYAKQNPFDFSLAGKSLSYCTIPRSEQDVIALFHEMVSLGMFIGYIFISTSQWDRYDSCFRTTYGGKSEYAYSRSDNPLGVGPANIGVKESMPSVLEYKFNLDGLIADFEKEVKFDTEIQLVVCWEIGKDYEEKYRVSSLLLGEEGSSRQYFGSTHALFHERQKRLEIIALKDLIEWHRNPDTLLAEHRAQFSS
jgi:hypothetical protein